MSGADVFFVASYKNNYYIIKGGDASGAQIEAEIGSAPAGPENMQNENHAINNPNRR